jgi:hypothetical protein
MNNTSLYQYIEGAIFLQSPVQKISGTDKTREPSGGL